MSALSEVREGQIVTLEFLPVQQNEHLVEEHRAISVGEKRILFASIPVDADREPRTWTAHRIGDVWYWLVPFEVRVFEVRVFG